MFITTFLSILWTIFLPVTGRLPMTYHLHFGVLPLDLFGEASVRVTPTPRREFHFPIWPWGREDFPAIVSGSWEVWGPADQAEGPRADDPARSRRGAPTGSTTARHWTFGRRSGPTWVRAADSSTTPSSPRLTTGPE